MRRVPAVPVLGGIDRAAAVGRPRAPNYGILVTLCRFDDKLGLVAYLGPFIPCERRLAHMEIPGIQGRAYEASFLKQGVWQAS